MLFIWRCRESMSTLQVEFTDQIILNLKIKLHHVIFIGKSYCHLMLGVNNGYFSEVKSFCLFGFQSFIFADLRFYGYVLNL